MKLKDLATRLEISLESLQNFIFDFGIDIYQAVHKNLEVTSEFQQFAEKNKSFLQKYDADHNQAKTIADIAKTLQRTSQEIEAFFQDNGLTHLNTAEFTTTVSSYLIDQYIGGNYAFITDAFPCYDKITEKELIGYSDLFFYITDMLDPFINTNQLQQWGILRPAGIVLYGPPGSGKIFWAKKIAEIIGYEFVHLYKDYLDSSNGNSTAKSAFNSFLMSKLKVPKTLLFIEDFDTLMTKNKDQNFSTETVDLINAIARHIQKNVHAEVVFVGAAEILSLINEDIVAPGRFDMHIPIFPPTEDERAELLLYHMISGLEEKSPLLEILKNNQALDKSYWESTAAQMKLFSNTMIIDFTQSLKKRIYALYRKDEKKLIELQAQLIPAAFNEARAKLTADYIKRCAAFLVEAQQNVATDFPHRIMELGIELDSYRIKQQPIRKIGYKTDKESEDELIDHPAPSSPQIDENETPNQDQ